MKLEYRYTELTVKNAVWLANSDHQKYPSKREWAQRVFEKLGVLPPLTQYLITSDGDVHKKGRRHRDWLRATESCKARLKASIETILEGEDPEYRSVWVDKNAQIHVSVDFSRIVSIWQRLVVADIEIVESGLPIVPTLTEFVAFATAILTIPLYRKRIRRCVVCNRYFIRRLPDRRSIVCGKRCRNARGDPNNAKRQAKHRAKKKSEQPAE